MLNVLPDITPPLLDPRRRKILRRIPSMAPLLIFGHFLGGTRNIGGDGDELPHETLWCFES